MHGAFSVGVWSEILTINTAIYSCTAQCIYIGKVSSTQSGGKITFMNVHIHKLIQMYKYTQLDSELYEIPNVIDTAEPEFQAA